MSRPVLLHRWGTWPFSGYFLGSLGDRASGLLVSWAGCITDGTEPVLGWRAGQAVHRALSRAGVPDADRRRALSILWARLDGVQHELVSPTIRETLTLLLVARDPSGVAVSGVGLESVYGVNEHQLAEPWVDGEHPLLGPPGFPHDRPGAVAVESAPEWLVGLRHSGHGSILGRTLPDIQRMCGISQ